MIAIEEEEWIKLEEAVQAVYQRILTDADVKKPTKLEAAALQEEFGTQELPVIDRKSLTKAQRHIAEAIAEKELQLWHDKADASGSILARNRHNLANNKRAHHCALVVVGVLPRRPSESWLGRLLEEDKFFEKKLFDAWLKSKYPRSTNHRSPGRPPNKTLDEFKDWMVAELNAHSPFKQGGKYKSGNAFARAVQNRIEKKTGTVIKFQTIRSRIRRIRDKMK